MEIKLTDSIKQNIGVTGDLYTYRQYYACIHPGPRGGCMTYGTKYDTTSNEFSINLNNLNNKCPNYLSTDIIIGDQINDLFDAETVEAGEENIQKYCYLDNRKILSGRDHYIKLNTNNVKDQIKHNLTIPYNLFVTGLSPDNDNICKEGRSALNVLSTKVTLSNDINNKTPTEDNFVLTGIKYNTSSQCTINGDFKDITHNYITLSDPKNIDIKVSGPIKNIYNNWNNTYDIQYYDVTGLEHYSYDGDIISYENIDPGSQALSKLYMAEGLYKQGTHYGGIDSNELTLYKYGSDKITLKCDDGDFISGYKINFDNKWYIKPYCIHVGPRTHCHTTTKQLHNIDDSKYVTLNTTEVGQSNSFDCYSYNSNVTGTFEFSCDSSGWSGIKSYCIPAFCPNKTLKINGKELTLNETPINTTLTFSCSDYLLPEQVPEGAEQVPEGAEQVPEQVQEGSEQVQEGNTFEITCNGNGEWDSVIKSNCPNKCLYISGSGIHSLEHGISSTITCLNGSEYTDTCNFNTSPQLNINNICSTNEYCILDPKWKSNVTTVNINSTVTTLCQDGEGTIEHTCLSVDGTPMWKRIYNCKNNNNHEEPDEPEEPDESDKQDKQDKQDETKFKWKSIYTILIIAVVVIAIIIIIAICVSSPANKITAHSKKRNSNH